MKPLFLSLVATISCCAITLAQDKTNIEALLESIDLSSPPLNHVPGTIYCYYIPTQAYKITIRSDNGLVSVLELPRGVFLQILVKHEQNTGAPGEGDMPHTFEGDITIRTRRADEIRGDENRIIDRIMAKAPMALELKNVRIEVEKVQ